MIISQHLLAWNEAQLNIREICLPQTKPSSTKLVFLHDALGSIASWKAFPQLLCSKLKMSGLIFERVGHGKSSVSSKPRPLDYLEKEAREVLPFVLSHFKIENPILIGCSDGASIALLYGAHHPDPVAIVSIAGHIKVEEITIEGIKKSLKKLKKISSFEKLAALHGNKTEALIQAWTKVWLSEDFRHWDISAQLQGIQCPTLILQGANDPYATQQHAKDLALAIGQQAKVIILEELGHFPHLERAEEVAAIIKNFFRDVAHF